MENVKTIKGLEAAMMDNTDLQNQFKSDPVKAIKNIAREVTPVPNTLVYQLVVGSLGLAVLLIIIAVVIISLMKGNTDEHIPTILTAIASGAIGALGGLLAPSPMQKEA